LILHSTLARKATRKSCTLLLTVSTMMLLPLPSLAQPIPPHKPRYVTAYVAQNSSDRLIDIVRSPPPATQSSYLAAITYGRTLGEGRFIRWEVEGQLVQHWGMQSHQELSAALVARWMHFPWDHWIDTRFAFGEGLSYASDLPAVEPRAGREGERTARLLNYLLVEWEFMLPQREAHSQWSVFTRIHHRSGVAGIFGNVRGGSNFVGVGVRYTY
jgi:hypothetical protein